MAALSSHRPVCGERTVFTQGGVSIRNLGRFRLSHPKSYFRKEICEENCGKKSEEVLLIRRVPLDYWSFNL
jgi:hypothetical protein